MDARTASNRRVADSALRTDGRGAGSGGTLVGLTTTDGVLLVADSRTSRGTTVAGSVRKIERVGPTAALGSTDDLGTVQSFVRAVRFEANRYETDREEPMALQALGTAASEALQAEPDQTATFVLGGVDRDGPHVFTIDPDGSLLKDPYVAAGTGRDLVYGVLDAEVAESPTMAEARRTAGNALAVATARDAPTGIEVHVAEITSEGVDIRQYESPDELQ